MVIKNHIVAAAIALSTFSMEVLATTPIEESMTRAVMDSYEQMLTANPKDYNVYFRRANEYYNRNMMAKALADVNAALEYAPAKEKDVRFQCYCLRGSIYESMGHYAEAVKDLDSALAIDPNNYTELYHKANCEYALGDYSAAKASYQKLQRLNTRSQEALFGLARVAVKEDDKSAAGRYANDAVELTPTSPDAYVHRAEIRQLLGENRGAADDLITAITLSDGKNLSRPIKALSDLSDSDYQAVNTALTSAITRSPRQGIYYYIRGVIAESHFKYPSALADFNYITGNGLMDFAGLYRSMAEAYYALQIYDKAIDNIDEAIGMSSDNISSYVIKCDIKRAMEAYRQAVTAADRGLAKDASYAPALVAKALALLGLNMGTEASVEAGKAVLAAPSDPYAKMVRAWILTDYDNQPEAAAKYYQEVVDLKTYQEYDLRSLRGFALLYTGRGAEAAEWMARVLNDSEALSDGEAEYYGACFYAAAGDADKAFACMENSLKKGYANRYNWESNTAARINVSALREDPRFNALLNRYSFVFRLRD